MAELAALNLVTSIITLVDFSAKVVGRLNEFNSRTSEAPETFRTLAIQLPLLTVTLQRVRHQAYGGYVEKDVVEALQPVIDETVHQTGYLNDELAKITPPQTASGLERGLKALRSMAREGKMIRALEKIHECINVLVLHQTTSGVHISTSVLNRLTGLVEQSPATKLQVPSAILLHQAVWQGELPSLRTMLRLDADINAVDEMGRTLLHTAAANGKTRVAKFLCDKVKSLDAEDDIGQTPLHIAVVARHVGTAHFLIHAGARDDVKDDNGRSPLDYAKGDFLTYWQIRHGMGSETKDSHTGNTALIQATCQGDLQAVHILLASGADVGAKNNRMSTALAEACMRGYTDIIAELLAHDADPNVTDQANWSPFTRCIWASQERPLIQLMESGRVKIHNPNTSERNSPIAEAAHRRQWSIVQLLLERGADPNDHVKGTSRGNDPILRIAGERVRDRKIWETLLQHGANPNATDVYGWSAMGEVFEHRNWSMLELLLKHGANPNGLHNSYPFICRLAMWNVDLPCIRLLVEHGADVNATNHDGWTALHEAAVNCNVDVLKELLTLGADPNFRIKNFRDQSNFPVLAAHVWDTPHSAEVISILLEHGSGLEDKDSQGRTALRIAIDRDHEDAACLLLLKGADPRAVAGDRQTPADQARKKKDMPQLCALLDALDRSQL